VISTRLSRCELYSTITTASAPDGSGAPVMMEAHRPLAMFAGMFSSLSPALISPITSSVAGSVDKSADRTA
jgi:hypothetical protein